MVTKSSVEHLNSFLREELAAVETYELVLDKIDPASALRDELHANLQSHETRVTVLDSAIREQGGTPVERAGPWDDFAGMIANTAHTPAERATVAALEEAEDHGLKGYRDADDLEPRAHRILADMLLPQQRATHDRVSALKDQV